MSVFGAALTTIDNEQMPAAIRGIAADMLATVAPEMDLPLRVAMSASKA